MVMVFTRIVTFIGKGTRGVLGDGLPRTEAYLSGPAGLAYDTIEDALLIAEMGSNKVRSVSFDGGFGAGCGDRGKVKTLLGTSEPGNSPSGVPASACLLNGPEAVDVDVFGDVYVADSKNNLVRRLNRSGLRGEVGTVDVVAGTAEQGRGTPGRPGPSVALAEPCGVRSDSRGNVYIVDYRNHRILVLDREGILNHYAGTGEPGFSGDGLPASGSAIAGPHGMAVDRDDDTYIVDNWNRRIRRVCSDTGVMTTVAGNGSYGFAGDGGPATEAVLSGPKDFSGVHAVWAGDGLIFIADSGNDRVRMVDRTGTISTVAGTGKKGYSGDGGDPLLADISGPHGIIRLPGGEVLFNEYLNHTVRALLP
jgi:hypothetical protein